MKVYCNTCTVFQLMFMYSLDRVLEKSTITVDILSVDRGKLDALQFAGDARTDDGCNCRLAFMKCCGRVIIFSSVSFLSF